MCAVILMVKKIMSMLDALSIRRRKGVIEQSSYVKQQPTKRCSLGSSHLDNKGVL